MDNDAKIRPKVEPFEAPFINVESTIIQPGMSNGHPNIKKDHYKTIAPTCKKIGTYIVNQIFGSDILIEHDTSNVNWVMPVLRETLEQAIYSIEGFIYIHIYNKKVYLENIKKCEIHNLKQKWDKIVSGTIIQDIPYSKDNSLVLKRHFKIENGITYLKMEAFKFKDNKEKKITIQEFNVLTDCDYIDNYILPYEAVINIDIGQDFFRNSKKLIIEEMNVINTLADEIQKTKTKVITSQHFQSGDIVTTWKPGNTHYNVESLTVGNLQDYFTLLPGDKEHKIFEYVQGEIRIEHYEKTFKFYDYQIIQQAGLSTASFGYEKDAYMNVANVTLSQNATEMTIEAIKTQIEGQISNLFINISKAQTSLEITDNLIPIANWDYGSNERFDDMKKLQVLRSIQGVMAIPYEYKAKIVLSLLKKIVDIDEEIDIDKMLEAYTKENERIEVEFGEV